MATKKPTKTTTKKKVVAKKPATKAKISVKKTIDKRIAKKGLNTLEEMQKSKGKIINIPAHSKNIIKYHQIKNNLNVVLNKKVWIKKGTNEELKVIIDLILSYNKKANKTLLDKITKAMTKPEVVAKKREIKKLETTKKELKKSITKKVINQPIEKLEKVKLTPTQMHYLELESTKTLRMSDAGYVHPITGRYWDGEFYG